MTLHPKQSETISAEDEEITLYDIWQMLVDGRGWIAGGTVLGLIAAAGYLAIAPSQYEATALVQVAQIAQGSQVSQVEPQSRTIERLKLVSFQDAVLKTLNWPQDSRAALYRASLKATPGKSPDLIDLRVRAFSRDDADRAIKVTIEQLASAHRALTRASNQSLNGNSGTEQGSIAAQIVEAEALLGRLDRLGKEIPPSKHSEILALLSMVEAQKSHLRALRRQEVMQTSTAALDPPFVSADPVLPKHPQTLLFATLGGSFLGVVAVMLRRSRQNWLRRSRAALPT